MRKAAVIRHVHFEDLGIFAPVLAERGYQARYFDAGVDDLQAPELAVCDLLIVLGAPIGVYDEDKYPFLTQEINLLESRLKTRRPSLGICLGAQLIARASGSRVYPGPAKEIGWSPLTLTAQGKQSVVRHLDGVPVLHWHGDTFDLPSGGERLASTGVCLNQAFAMGRNVIAFQFHPEANGDAFEPWLIGHAAEMSAVPGLSVNRLRADTQRFAPRLAPPGRQCLSDWLGQLDAPNA